MSQNELSFRVFYKGHRYLDRFSKIKSQESMSPFNTQNLQTTLCRASSRFSSGINILQQGNCPQALRK